MRSATSTARVLRADLTDETLVLTVSEKRQHPNGVREQTSRIELGGASPHWLVLGLDAATLDTLKLCGRQLMVERRSGAVASLRWVETNRKKHR